MKSDHRYCVYIIQCSDGKYYTRVTNNVDRRISEHNSRIDPKGFTYSRRPVVLKYCCYFRDINHAIAVEKQLKGWSRKKKEALFVEDWDQMQKLAESYSRKITGQDPSTGLRVTY